MAERAWNYDLDAAKEDRLAVLLTVRIERDLDDLFVAAEGYWHAEEKTFWWANTGPHEQYAEALAEGDIIAWMPMPEPANPKD